MHRGRGLEVVAVALIVAVLAGVWLAPASGALLRGASDVYLGEGSDSITNPWQYELIIEASRTSPWSLLRGALYTDQASAPAGQALFIPWSERALCLLFAPFLNTAQMVTAIVWAYLVAAGLAMHACGRVLGWSRAASLVLAIAWSLCPYTRARAVCHVALVSVYFAPCVVLALALLAGRGPARRWSDRRRIAVGALLLVCAISAAHYYVMMLVAFAPLLALLYFVLSRDLPWRRRIVSLGLAGLPAGGLLLWMSLCSLASADAARVGRDVPAAERVRSEQRHYLSFFGAKPVDYLAGDVDFGDRDLISPRAALTRAVRSSVTGNFHERTNGIRWSLLALALAAPLVMVTPTGRRAARSQHLIVVWALLLAFSGFLVSLGSQVLVVGGVDLGPAVVVNTLLPGFRVANRAGVLVHFAVLVCAGTTLHWLEGRLRDRGQRRGLGIVAGLLVLGEYLPLHALPARLVEKARGDLERAGACGVGVTVPYVTYGFHDDAYFSAFTSLRGTSCKLLHAAYLTGSDDELRAALSSDTFDGASLERSLAFARCVGASWAIFPAHVPQDYRHQFCQALGWSWAGDDACRGPLVPPPERPLEACAR